ncbi:hypothetical protein SAMN05443144_106162 [Fodinibius roseus]|uniref:DUF6268 domain-containing protein n=1 Tax=Fodinibius roseus TaxID=1194090 RepID=A0A1M4ZXX2_9BACT|nr:DUF6268 family outer membrane beta-barrel protein [Fodinibius roseus]SHF22532.1 hypothetical protein SAMN05443144_106162 [Fodinibius roseus]
MNQIKTLLLSTVSTYLWTPKKKKGSAYKNLSGILLIGSSLLYTQPVLAQLRPSLSFGHETWPSMSVSNLELDQTYNQGLDDLKVWTDTRFIRGSYPIIMQGGLMFLDVQPGFQRIEFRHENWTEELPRPTDAYIIDLNIIVQRQLKNRWSLLGQVTPAIKSGLEEKLAGQDFAIEGAFLAIRQANERFAFGFGAAYSTNFGAPIPIPLLQFDYQASLWAGGPAWRGNALLPSSIEAWVIPTRRVEIGIQLQSLGDRHHITEIGTVPLDKPYSDYFDTVLGPSVIVYLTPWLNLNVESGISIYRQMQITDGRNEVIKFEPDQAGFLRWKFTVGGQSPLRDE